MHQDVWQYTSSQRESGGKGKDCGNIDIYKSKQSPGESFGEGRITSVREHVSDHVHKCISACSGWSVCQYWLIYCSGPSVCPKLTDGEVGLGHSTLAL